MNNKVHHPQKHYRPALYIIADEVAAVNNVYNLLVLRPDLSKEYLIIETLVESFLIHARNTINFLEDNGNHKDDLSCKDFKDSSEKIINGVDLGFDSSFKVALNKHLAHITKIRVVTTPSWNVRLIRDRLNQGFCDFRSKCSSKYFNDLKQKESFDKIFDLYMSNILPKETFDTYFSCFSNHPVRYKKTTYKTAEHAYQCRQYTDPKIISQIRSASTAKEAWSISQEHKNKQISDFNDKKRDVMKDILHAKLRRNEDVWDMLFSTETYELKYESKDTYWGTGSNGKGKNELGKLWTEIRDWLNVED